jgi:hypothetical protein
MAKIFKSYTLWVLICVLLISYVDGLRGRLSSESPFDPELFIKNTQKSRHQLAEVNRVQANAQAGEMVSIRDASRFPSESIADAIRIIPGHKTYANFIWQDSVGGVFAFAAQGIDKNHYFANSYLTGYVPFETEKVWVPLATLAQRKTYQFDHQRYGISRQDVWQNSQQAYLNSHGDCEDHAIILADWLLGLGFEARVAIGELPEGGHAWVVLYYMGKEYVLEATSKSRPRSMQDFKLAKFATRYRPKFMFDRDHFWENSGTVFTTRYHGENWLKQSRFVKNEP